MMKIRRVPLLLAVTVAFLSVTVTFQETQAKRQMSKTDILDGLKPGQWVQLEGVIQQDLTALCQEVKFLTGDFVDDDWEIAGVVRWVNPANGEMKIMNLPIRAQKDTEYSNEAGTFKKFDDLKTGMFVEVEGTYLKDGSFLAKEIEDDSPKLGIEPSLQHEIQVTGRVQSVDKTKGVLMVMGQTFKLTDLTKGKSAMK